MSERQPWLGREDPGSPGFGEPLRAARNAGRAVVAVVAATRRAWRWLKRKAAGAAVEKPPQDSAP